MQGDIVCSRLISGDNRQDTKSRPATCHDWYRYVASISQLRLDRERDVIEFDLKVLSRPKIRLEPRGSGSDSTETGLLSLQNDKLAANSLLYMILAHH